MKLAVAALLALFAMIGVMAFFQDQLLFPTHAVARAGSFPRNGERLEIETSSGDVLHGIHMKPSLPKAAPGTLVVGFGGNAWNAQHVAEYLHDVYPEADIVAFHYRGYAPSTGTPSAEALVGDAPLVLRSAIAAAKPKPKRVVAVGFSIGSGVAASLAGQPGLDGLILVTPFDSLKAVAASFYPWLPVGSFFRHEINASELLSKAKIPTALIAAERDEIVRPARTAALRPSLRDLRFDMIVPAAGHNDIYGRSDFREGMRDALEAVAPK